MLNKPINSKPKIITIIAPNIKNGGGKELLLYLLDYLEENYTEIKVIVYLDSSLSDISEMPNRQIILLSSPIEKIQLFYKKIDNALYFGNLPPLRKANNTMVYFHNPYLLMGIQELYSKSISLFLKYSLQQFYIKHFIKNAHIVACQNTLIENKFNIKYNFMNVKLLPFFRVCSNSTKPQNKIYDFCYVSLAHPHKNHTMLLNALEILSRKNISLTLALTIEVDKTDLIQQIEKINSEKIIKIHNLGVLPKEEVCTLYAQSRCLIFPSKEETFGLGLIEAIDMDLDIIAANLNYVYQVIEPSNVFDPNDPEDCAEVIERYLLEGSHKKSVGLIENEINALINILIEE